MGECAILAKELSQNYRSTDPFRKNEDSLPIYLSKHGILLTMCFPFECTIPMGATHLSGSWINQQTGVQVIQGAHLGLILDPFQVDIHCLYPTDAGSDGRDNSGCGAPFLEPTHGSKGASSYNWITRNLVQKKITNYKNFNFGVDTDWQDIECEFFFPTAHGQNGGQHGSEPISPLAWDTSPDGQIRYQNILPLLENELEAIMGHPVCHCSDESRDTSTGLFLLHQGTTPWGTRDWQEAIDIQLQFIHEESNNHTVLWHWNEIVMSLPKPQMQDAVLALFYLDSPAMDEHSRADALARLQALSLVMGGKPYMSLHTEVSIDVDLLTCPDEKDVSRIQGLPASFEGIQLHPLVSHRDRLLSRQRFSFRGVV